MSGGQVMTEIEQTYYGKMFMEGHMIKVTTKSGWVSDTCRFMCEISWPYGLDLENEAQEKFFVPFENIDHIQIVD